MFTIHDSTEFPDTTVNETNSREEQPGGLENASQVGQAVHLAGSAREVSSVTIRLANWPTSPSSHAEVDLTISESSDGMPGDPVWSGTETYDFQDKGPADSEFTDLEFPAPHVLVQDEVFVSVAFTDIEVGSAFGWNTTPVGGTEVGSIASLPQLQDSDSLVWTENDFFGPDPLAMRIEAVPAPASLALLSLGAATAGRRRLR